MVLCAGPGLAAEPDTLNVFDASVETAGGLPSAWKSVLPDGQRVYTSYNIEQSGEGAYLRARSSGAFSLLELDAGQIDIREYPVLEWEWKVDLFPNVTWEQDPKNDDFAFRIELVYDFKGSALNPLNILRKGLITSLFRKYPPQRVIDYVWSVSVPSAKAYQSPSSKRITVIPIESGTRIAGTWLRERINIQQDLALIEPYHTLYLKKIRLIVDTDNSGSTAESGLKYLRLVKVSNSE